MMDLDINPDTSQLQRLSLRLQSWFIPESPL